MGLGAVGVVVAARTSSTRLPGKALLPLQGIPMVPFLLRRLRGLQSGRIVLATTALRSDDELAAVAAAEGVPVFRGADSDVVGRYVAAAKEFGFDTIARVTADCPFVDAELVDWCIARTAEAGKFDLATTKGRFAVGLDVELYHAETMAALDRGGGLSAAQREHLTLCFYERPEQFVVRRIDPRPEWTATTRTFTVDTRADYERALALAAKFDGPVFDLKSLLVAAAQ